MKDLILKRFEAKDFLGINSDNPVIIDFTEARKNQKVVKLTGDQGAGKTSTMTGIMYLMGAAFNIDNKNFKNLKDNTIDLNLDFEYDGEKYNVTASGATGRIVLKKFMKEVNKFITLNEPKALLREIFGNLGISPMFLRELSGKKQIQWFKDTFGDDPKISKKEEELVKSIDTLFAQRRDVNRDIKALKGALDVNPLYQDYERSQEKFKAAPNAKKEKEELDSLQAKMNEYNKARTGLDGLKQTVKSCEQDIEELEEKLKEKKKLLETASKRVADGEAYIKENKNIEKDYNAANEAWMKLSKTLADYEQWKDVVKKEKEYLQMVDASQQADGQLDDLRKKLLELTEKYLPKIKGLEIRVKTGLTDEEEGIYYEGKTLAQLSESELWQLFVQVYEAKGVQFVFCENINALGSNAISILNSLVKAGASVFASEMDRTKKEMSITFETKIS